MNYNNFMKFARKIKRIILMIKNLMERLSKMNERKTKNFIVLLYYFTKKINGIYIYIYSIEISKII